MARRLTFAECDQALRDFDKRLPLEILIGMNDGGQLIVRVMQNSPIMKRLGTARDSTTGAFVTPPLPPPGPLGIRTGALAASIRMIRPRQQGAQMFVLGFEVGVPYGLIHELGGQTRPHTIVPRRASVLRFPGRGGGVVFARSVFHPGSRIPARPYAKPAIVRSMPTFQNIIDARIQNLATSLF